MIRSNEKKGKKECPLKTNKQTKNHQKKEEENKGSKVVSTKKIWCILNHIYMIVEKTVKCMDDICI